MTEHRHPDAKNSILASGSAQPSNRYPVSSKAYRRKDYEYISTFHFTLPSNLKECTRNSDYLHQRFDVESDCSLSTRSSIDSPATTSFSSSTSYASTDSYGKCSKSRDVVNNSIDRFSSLNMDENIQEPQSVMVEERESDDDATGDAYHDKSCVVVDEAGAEVCQPNAEPIQNNTHPTAFPRFGDWNTSDVSCGGSYTEIFENLRYVAKKSKGMPVSPSSSGNTEQELHHVQVQNSRPLYETGETNISSQHDCIQHANISTVSKSSFLRMFRRNK